MRPMSISRPLLGILLLCVFAQGQATNRALPEFTALVAENGPPS